MYMYMCLYTCGTAADVATAAQVHVPAHAVLLEFLDRVR